VRWLVLLPWYMRYRGLGVYGPQPLSYPFRDSENEASIRVPRMFHSHVQQQYDKQIPCSVI
jgi:hypothetical protein